MVYLVVDLKEEKSFSFRCKTDAARKLGVSVKTLYNWRKKCSMRRYGNYLVDCSCEEVKCVARNVEGKGLQTASEVKEQTKD